MARPRVIQTEELDPAAGAWLRESCDLVYCHFADPGLPEALKRAEGLVVRTYTRVDAALLAMAPALRVVGRAGVGLDRIDVEACRRRGVEVVHTPDANGDAVAEFVFGLLLDRMRPRMYLDRALDQGAWSRARREHEAHRQLCELTLGVLGLGRIGGRVARIGAGFGMRVLYHDVAAIPESRRMGAEPVTLEALLAQSDIVTVHVDNRPSNRGLVDASYFARMRFGAVFMNTSRGHIVDTAALAAWLRANPECSALLDVHEPEPLPADSPVLGLPNAFLTPHLAAATSTAHANMSWVVKDVWRVLKGEAPLHPAPACGGV